LFSYHIFPSPLPDFHFYHITFRPNFQGVTKNKSKIPRKNFREGRGIPLPIFVVNKVVKNPCIFVNYVLYCSICAVKHETSSPQRTEGNDMGTQFFWFFDILIVAILLGVTYKCVRAGFVAGITNFLGTLLGFAIALGVSGPAASQIYDTFVSPGVVENITYLQRADVAESNAGVAFETLRKADMSQALVNDVPMAEFLRANPATEGEILKLNLNGVDLSQTGIADGNLDFFGVDAQFDFIFVNVGSIDLTAAERAQHSIEDIILARTVSYAISHRASEKHSILTSNLFDTLPGVSRASHGTTDVVAKLLLEIIHNDATDLATVIETNMVRPMTVLPLRLLVFAVAFALVSIGISAICNGLHFVDYIPLVGRINSILGGVLGVLFSTVIIFMVVVAVGVVIALTEDNIIFINSMTVEQTYIFRHIYSIGFLRFA
jgi:hypothetical protein